MVPFHLLFLILGYRPTLFNRLLFQFFVFVWWYVTFFLYVYFTLHALPALYNIPFKKFIGLINVF